MLNKLKDYFFWFSQPPTILVSADKKIGYLFAASLIIGVIFWIWSRFVENQINKKLIKKLSSLAFYTGFAGLFWLGLRFENVPIFGRRYWAGVVGIVAIIWLGFIVKYLIRNYGK